MTEFVGSIRQQVKLDAIPPFVRRSAQHPKWRGLYSPSSLPVYLRGVWEIPGLIAWIRALPAMTVTLSARQREMFSHSLWRGTTKLLRRGWARTIIVFPDDLSDFFRGQDRRNLRTGARGAQRAGFYTQWTSGSDLFDAVAEIAQRRGWRDPLTLEKFVEMAGDPPEKCHAVVVRGADGHADCVNLGVWGDDLFVLRVAFTTTAGHPRWLCFNQLIRELHRRGVRVLVGDQITSLTLGNIEFQRHVGFEVANLRFT